MVSPSTPTPASRAAAEPMADAVLVARAGVAAPRAAWAEPVRAVRSAAGPGLAARAQRPEVAEAPTTPALAPTPVARMQAPAGRSRGRWAAPAPAGQALQAAGASAPARAARVARRPAKRV